MENMGSIRDDSPVAHFLDSHLLERIEELALAVLAGDDLVEQLDGAHVFFLELGVFGGGGGGVRRGTAVRGTAVEGGGRGTGMERAGTGGYGGV